MSGFSENDVQRAAEIREWLTKEISDKEEELDRLRKMLNIVDALLKRSSFKPASTITRQGSTYSYQNEPTVALEADQIEQVDESLSAQKPPMSGESPYTKEASRIEASEIRELRRATDSLLLARAEISSGEIEITVSDDLSLNVNTPPFKTFFLNRILDGMKSKDQEKLRKGEINNSTECIDYQIFSDDEGTLKSIKVTNYRERERLQDVISTMTWVLSKMVDKGSQQKHG
jgi:hypothetical protein